MALVSIVTGTYNRLSSLQAMIQSVREQMPRGFDYDFIICDGGSTDGTLAWLESQPDVNVIAHGSLRGAIRAFTDAAMQSTARYTMLANDDVTLLPGSIVRAVVYLEDNPTCGAVAFAHNIAGAGTAQVWGDWYVSLMRADNGTSVTYAQVGLFRTELGQRAGWWGADDALMASGGGTYGGDNYLSARIWEMGYSVDAVHGVGNVDHLMADGLRQRNYDMEHHAPGAFYKRYPLGAPIGERVSGYTNAAPRVLWLPIFEPGHPKLRENKRGLREAMQRAGVLVYEWDYINTHGDLAEIVRAFQPDLLFMQLQDAHYLQPRDLASARAIRPSMVVINWNGDVWDVGLISPAVLALLEHVDLQLTVNASVIADYEARGIAAAYWQWAAEPLNGELPRVQAHDVLFLGNNYSPQRAELGTMLRALPGVNVGIYGRHWPRRTAMGENLYDYATGAALYRAAKIAIGDSQFAARGFVSNRLFEALANGAFLLHQTIPGAEELLGLIDGEHYIVWSDLADLRNKLLYWLRPEQTEARNRIRGAAERFANSRHSFDVRVCELFALIPKAKAAWELKTSSSSRAPVGMLPTP